MVINWITEWFLRTVPPPSTLVNIIAVTGHKQALASGLCFIYSLTHIVPKRKQKGKTSVAREEINF